MKSDVLGILLGNTENVGDSIITLATNKLANADCYLDRDTGKHLNSCSESRSHRVLVTGWLTHNPENWPIETHEAKFTSIHVTKTVRNNVESSDIFFNDRTIKLMRESGTIGCRDTSTLHMVKRFGLEANFSGCVTMCLTPVESVIRRRIAIVDAPPKVVRLFRSLKSYEVIEIRHEIDPTESWLAKLIRGQELIDLYSTCEFVISTRLHAVVPALALGAKSCLIMDNTNDLRFTPLKSLIPTIQNREFTSFREILEACSGASSDYFTVANSLKNDIHAWL